jgi:RimJ/RimL family protein N-acetyltransferase
MSMVDEENWFEDIAKTKNSKQVCSIVLKEGSKLIGNISIFKIDWQSRTAEIGIAIGEQDRLGKGLGTEATLLWLKYAFLSLNLRQLYWGAFGFNGRSIACAKKCGYKEISRIPNHLYIDGQYHDIVYLMVTRENWEPLWQEFETKMKGEESE